MKVILILRTLGSVVGIGNAQDIDTRFGIVCQMLMVVGLRKVQCTNEKMDIGPLATIWVCAYMFGMIMIIGYAKADWIMKKPITYKEESKVNSSTCK